MTIVALLWVGVYDDVTARTLPPGGPLWAAAGVSLGALLASWVFAVGPAATCQRSGLSTFDQLGWALGVWGRDRVASWALGIAGLLLLVLAVHFAVELSFAGLNALGGLDPIAPQRFGWVSSDPVRWITTTTWAVVLALVGCSTLFTRMVLMLVKFGTVLPPLALGTIFLITLADWSGIGTLVEGLEQGAGGGPEVALGGSRLDEAVLASRGPDAWLGLAIGLDAVAAVGLVVAWFLADWGATLKTRGELKLTAAVGVGIAVATSCLLALAVVALRQSAEGWGTVENPLETLTFHRVVWNERAVAAGGWRGIALGVAAVILACASLAHGVFAAHWGNLGLRRVTPAAPPIRWAWAIGGVAAILTLIGLGDRPAWLWLAVAGLVGPLAAVLAVQARRGIPEDPTLVPRWRAAGLIAWVLGVLVAGIGLAVRVSGGLEGRGEAVPFAILSTLSATVAAAAGHLAASRLGRSTHPSR